jgi:hypothetical protein
VLPLSQALRFRFCSSSVWCSPADPQDAGTWLTSNWKTVNLALSLLPFAGVAFLWFIGVLRDRMGVYEDQFFATVFLGSGLLFLAMVFASSAIAGGIIIPRLRAGTRATPERRRSLLGSASLPAVGAPDQRVHTPCKS